MDILSLIIEFLRGAPSVARQCRTCGWLQGDGFCDRYECDFVVIKNCEKCGSAQRCFGDVVNSDGTPNCPFAERIRQNAARCRDRKNKR